jgi:hypothetical protein
MRKQDLAGVLNNDRHFERGGFRALFEIPETAGRTASKASPCSDLLYEAARRLQSRGFPLLPPDSSPGGGLQNIGAAAPVGLFPDGATPEGVDYMAGNVFELMDGPK